MRNLLSIPFLLFPFIAFNVLLIFKPSMLDYHSIPRFTLELPTTGIIRLSVSDIIVASAFLLFSLQFFKNLKVERVFLFEQVGTVMIFLALATQFIFIRSATNSHCILLVFISLLDVLALFLIRKKGRNFNVGNIH